MFYGFIVFKFEVLQWCKNRFNVNVDEISCWNLITATIVTQDCVNINLKKIKIAN